MHAGKNWVIKKSSETSACKRYKCVPSDES